ncbi:MAG: cation-translocating P-type ATPase, partial [Fusicatenibacter sp.]
MKEKRTKPIGDSMGNKPAVRYQANISTGLSQKQVQERVSNGWKNTSIRPESRTIGKIIKSNLLTYYNLIFAILAVLVLLAGSLRSLTFLPVVVANLFIGIIQEIRAKRTLDKLTMLNAPKTLVIRDGVQQEIPAEDLVLDDVVIFRSGNQICADAE